MPPLGTGVWPAEKKPVEPEPERAPEKVDRKSHYAKHEQAVKSIVDHWVVGGGYSILDIINRIQSDDTIINRLDKSVGDGFLSNRTREVIMKVHMGDQALIDKLKKEFQEKAGELSVDIQDWIEDEPSIDSGVSTIPDPVAEGIILDVFPHLLNYLYLFANESWYGLTGSAASAALSGTYSMKRKALIEAALGKYIKQGWTPIKSSMAKADWMKDYDLDQKWPERIYDLRESRRKRKVKVKFT